MVHLENIKKSFGDKQVLNGVSLNVNKGDVVVIIGPSGTGKSTLLRCINFLEHADAGQITVGNLTVDSNNASQADILELRRKTSMVFQHYNLFKNKTALENVMEGLITVQKVPRKEATERAMAELEKVGLKEKADFYPSQLSGGQQQRIGIARALVLNPELILFDEPTSALDPELVGEVLQTIKRIAASGMTMIVVTHEINFAKNVANHVVFMENGEIIEEGAPKDLLFHPQTKEAQAFLKNIITPFVYEI